ncbi:hypothetical protein TSAR_004934 [Trichomalopsis sarcophagae]|uniref:Uncharacterized protein n=1 Tax=Trichomalopsis sarcophagae TaxID=543379 RepID=A0A232EIW5_9HYME|nr:hypothetical protein TSAR_004934 [Trichomalopsis sarcophagae]
MAWPINMKFECYIALIVSTKKSGLLTVDPWIDEDSEEFFGTDVEDEINDDGDIFHDSDDNNYDWVNNFEADDTPEEITFEKLRNLCNSDEGNAKIEGLVTVLHKRLRNYDDLEDFSDGTFYKKFIKSLPLKV